MHENGGGGGPSGGSGAYSVPKWVVTDFKFLKPKFSKPKITKIKVTKPTFDSSNSPDKLRSETNELKNRNKGTGEVPKAQANTNAGNYLANKAPNQVTPGTRELSGQYVDDMGRVQPWKAYYDEYGRIIGGTDYNAGNKAQGIPDTHYHTYEWGPGKTPYESGSHIKGEFKP